jgi:hypothetical protein
MGSITDTVTEDSKNSILNTFEKIHPDCDVIFQTPREMESWIKDRKAWRV